MEGPKSAPLSGTFGDFEDLWVPIGVPKEINVHLKSLFFAVTILGCILGSATNPFWEGSAAVGAPGEPSDSAGSLNQQDLTTCPKHAFATPCGVWRIDA